MKQYLKRSREATEKTIDNTVVKEYFSNESPRLGLATANIKGSYPPKSQWAMNEKVDELYYCTKGVGRITLQGIGAYTLKRNDAVLIPKGTKYKITGNIQVVIPTSPSWTIKQHKWTA